MTMINSPVMTGKIIKPLTNLKHPIIEGPVLTAGKIYWYKSGLCNHYAIGIRPAQIIIEESIIVGLENWNAQHTHKQDWKSSLSGLKIKLNKCIIILDKTYQSVIFWNCRLSGQRVGVGIKHRNRKIPQNTPTPQPLSYLNTLIFVAFRDHIF
ncbi:MAG: hypothetical protein GY799_21105 [Desulfobulbaceae bacterium]|nr:hypothetical protein [Desulfobulbaceae bacterium]